VVQRYSLEGLKLLAFHYDASEMDIRYIVTPNPISK
jgi:hypothetical protein